MGDKITEMSEEPTVESQNVFNGKIINVRVDTVSMPDGKLATREIVEHAECVCVATTVGFDTHSLTPWPRL